MNRESFSSFNMTERIHERLGERYYHLKHKSGLDIYIFPKDFTTTYALFGTKFGSVNNIFRTDRSDAFRILPDGIAHFLEHKMFESEDGEDLFEKFARTGASANAYTSYTSTMYLFSCTENFEKSLEILLKGVTSPYFTKENVEKEQGIIAQEIKMYEDNVHDACYNGLLSAMYRSNSVRIPIAGSVSSIAEITPELLYKCYKTFYNLNNMALCVCGNADPSNIISICDRVLKKAEPIDIEYGSTDKDEPKEVCTQRITKKMQVSKPIFSIGIKDTDISSSDALRLKKLVMMEVLADCLFGESSSFSLSLYEEGLTRNLISPYVTHNAFFSFIDLHGESEDPERVFDRFKEYIGHMKISGVDKDTFTRVLRSSYGDILGIFDSVDSIANEFLGFIMNGFDIFDYMKTFEEITLEDINSLLCELFDEKYYTLSTVFPIN
ncbi:MAG: insulinase family protein [Clostridia bacterium]|nr:insulinase family protein [Clostridia bacterium]